MYKLISYSDGSVLVTNDSPAYRAAHLVGSAEEAENLVVGLNQSGLMEQLAAHRFEFETSGLTLEGGMRLKTDRESQAQLSSAYTTLKYNLIPDTDWKALNGWQVVTLEQIEPIARAMAAHVRGCFRGERAVGTAITNATTMEQIESIDIPVQFNAAYEAAFAEVMAVEQAPE